MPVSQADDGFLEGEGRLTTPLVRSVRREFVFRTGEPMPLPRDCDWCGTAYVPRRSSRFCSDRCRMRYKRSPLAVLGVPHPSRDGRVGDLEAATGRELRAVGAVDSPEGQLALVLARRMESPAESGGSVASLSKELRRVMAGMTNEQEFDPLDELRLRRDRRRLAP